MGCLKDPSFKFNLIIYRFSEYREVTVILTVVLIIVFKKNN
jgi:hypothetical protein